MIMVGEKMTNYSKNIKKWRKKKKWTQAELASGITSQGMISKIEKNTISPDIDLLEKIAYKLDSTLIDLLTNDSNDELNFIYSHINNLILKREYELLAGYVDSENKIEKIKKQNKGYYYWIQAIISALHYGKYEEGIELLELALKNNKDIQLNVRILNNLSAFYSVIEKYEDALDYSQQAKKLADTIQIDNKLKQQIYFQQARLHSNIQEYSDAIFFSKIAVEYTVSINSLFLLDDLYLLIGNSYKELGELKKAEENTNIAYTIATIKSHSQLLPYIERTQKQIEELFIKKTE